MKGRQSQTTHIIVMVRPDHFGFNPQTTDNTFQIQQDALHPEQDRELALQQFIIMRDNLTKQGITVIELPSPEIVTPDAVFPNNWFSTHEDGTIVFYPMAAENRRHERQITLLQKQFTEKNIRYSTLLDLTAHEQRGTILEGTGSLILDRKNKIAYANESRRTTKKLFDEWTQTMGYEGIFFRAGDTSAPPYHTNVLMSIGTDFAVVAEEMIVESDRAHVRGRLESSGREIISLSGEQVSLFCGNILELSGTSGPKILMSTTAFGGFTSSQKKQLEKFGELVAMDIPTIEQIGGGSVRCMMAEIFVPTESVSQ